MAEPQPFSISDINGKAMTSWMVCAMHNSLDKSVTFVRPCAVESANAHACAFFWSRRGHLTIMCGCALLASCSSAHSFAGPLRALEETTTTWMAAK